MALKSILTQTRSVWAQVDTQGYHLHKTPVKNLEFGTVWENNSIIISDLQDYVDCVLKCGAGPLMIIHLCAVFADKFCTGLSATNASGDSWQWRRVVR